jgi:hypothetical protein
MALDHGQIIFHPAYPRCEKLRVSENGKVYVDNISNLTHIYHFNGASKYRSGCKGYYSGGWFKNLEKPTKLDDSVILVGNRNEKYTLSVSKICPYIWSENFTWIEPGQGHRWKISIRKKVFEK